MFVQGKKGIDIRNQKNGKEELLNHLMWDYDISTYELSKLLSGEINSIEHYDLHSLFKKTLEAFPWFTVLQLFDIEVIKKMLTKELISKLRTTSLREKYFYVKERLQEIVPTTR